MRAGVLILAGGEATRLPGKLALDAGDVPMLARVYRNVSPGRETWLSVKGALPPGLDALVPAPAAVDRWSLRGPLAGLLTTMARMRSRWVFAVAGDAPLVDAAFIETLWAARRDGDEAVVPVRESGGRMQYEPLAALYDRLAFLRAGFPVLRSDRGALRAVIDRMRTQTYAAADPRIFTNVGQRVRPASAEPLGAALPDLGQTVRPASAEPLGAALPDLGQTVRPASAEPLGAATLERQT
jgi:molybdopterin-guanine dinucleotide biosynthesis protein A